MKETGKGESERFYQSCTDKEQFLCRFGTCIKKGRGGKGAIRKGASSRRLWDQVKAADKMR